MCQAARQVCTERMSCSAHYQRGLFGNASLASHLEDLYAGTIFLFVLAPKLCAGAHLSLLALRKPRIRAQFHLQTLPCEGFTSEDK